MNLVLLGKRGNHYRGGCCICSWLTSSLALVATSSLNKFIFSVKNWNTIMALSTSRRLTKLHSSCKPKVGDKTRYYNIMQPNSTHILLSHVSLAPGQYMRHCSNHSCGLLARTVIVHNLFRVVLLCCVGKLSKVIDQWPHARREVQDSIYQLTKGYLACVKEKYEEQKNGQQSMTNPLSS